MTPTSTAPHGNNTRTHAMRRGRQADSERRRQRVTAALDRARSEGNEISASAIARAAGVDRSFLYRHPDLLGQIHTAATTPPPTAASPGVTRASLQADLAAANERTQRLAGRIRQLETRLSDTLGETAWRESGLVAPTDIDTLHAKIAQLEQQTIDLHLQLDERDQDLAAARAANRELMAQINTQPQRRRHTKT
jgi:uncharacterized protein YceH (UPF0502 family)